MAPLDVKAENNPTLLKQFICVKSVSMLYTNVQFKNVFNEIQVELQKPRFDGLKKPLLIIRRIFLGFHFGIYDGD